MPIWIWHYASYGNDKRIQIESIHNRILGGTLDLPWLQVKLVKKFKKKQIDLNGHDVLMVWYLYTVVKYIRRMHFSLVEFVVLTVMRINASSWTPKIIRSFTVLLFYIIILFTEASMWRRQQQGLLVYIRTFNKCTW